MDRPKISSHNYPGLYLMVAGMVMVPVVFLAGFLYMKPPAPQEYKTKVVVQVVYDFHRREAYILAPDGTFTTTSIPTGMKANYFRSHRAKVQDWVY